MQSARYFSRDDDYYDKATQFQAGDFLRPFESLKYIYNICFLMRCHFGHHDKKPPIFTSWPIEIHIAACRHFLGKASPLYFEPRLRAAEICFPSSAVTIYSIKCTRPTWRVVRHDYDCCHSPRSGRGAAIGSD